MLGSIILFDHPDYSRGDEKLHVRIRRLLTGIDLVGMVGGQMGLFLGFSFIGSIAWLLNAIGGYYARFSNKKFKQNFNHQTYILIYLILFIWKSQIKH